MSSIKICKVENCNKKAKAHGYCNTHYEQIRIYGKLLEPKTLNKDKICLIEGCNNPVLNKNYCSKHYQQIWKYGKILEDKHNDLYKNKEWLNQKYNIELLDIKDIAKLCNVKPATINKYLNKYRISLQYVEPELHSRLLYIIKKQNNIKSIKEYLIEEYWNKNKSAIVIGEQLGDLDRRLITDWMELLNVKKRGNTEAKQKYNAQNITPTKKQWQIILGSWLGDGNIRRTTNCINTQLRITHGEDQYEYLQYKKSILEENNLLFFTENSREGGSTFKNSKKRYEISSQHTPLLNDIYDKCYPNGKAIFNKEYFYQLDDYGLFIWYLDDGSLQRNKHIILCTDNFTYEDVVEMQNYFKKIYNTDTKIFSIRENQYRLRFNQENTQKFFNIINKYKNEVKCMNYKFIN